MGTSWTQATESKKPEYQASGWAADGGPCVSFDNVGEALSAGDLIGGLSEVSIAATAKTDAASGVLVEHGTPNYYSVNGLGFGTGGTSEYWAGNGQSGGSNWELGSDTITGNEHVWGATFDRAAAMGSELEFSKDSVVQTPGTDEADDTTGTFAADTTYMGARADGGSLPWNGTVREIVIIGRKLTTAELRTLTDALAARGRL